MSISGLIAGGGIPEGDQYRETDAVTLLDNTLTTVLSESSGSGGILWGWLFGATASSITRIKEVRLTVDGNPERTFDWTALSMDFSNATSGTATRFIYLPMPVDYVSSITLKMRHNDNSGSSARAKALYSHKT